MGEKLKTMKLSPDFYSELLLQLRKAWPESLMVYGVINSLERGLPLGLNVWVDKWPNPEAIIVNADIEKCQNPLWKSCVLIYETNVSCLKELLIGEQKVTLDETRRLLFPGITSQTSGNIISILPEKNIVGDFYDMYWIQQDDTLIDKPLRNGFETGQLTREVADLVQENSPYGRDGFADGVYMAASYNYPNEVVYDKLTGAAVGWYMQNCIFGSLANLVVLPEYRQLGLGKYMISSLTKKVIERDSVAFMHVAQDNSLSIKIHKEMGFKFGGIYAYKVLIPDS